jgi:5-methylcytosine-specific restriction endonuclease McrA
MQQTKTCSRCFEEKPITEYRQDKRRPHIRLSFCRTCYNKQCSAWNKKNHERMRANQKRWLAENRDRWNAYLKQWREATRATSGAKRRAWRVTIYRQRERELERVRYWADVEKSRKRRRDRSRVAYHADIEATRAKQRARYAQRADYYKALVHWYRVRHLGGTGRYEAADIFAIYRAQRGRCAYCPKRLGKFYCVDHIEAASKGGSNDRRNLQLTCRSCNSRKGAKDPIVFAQSLGRLL